MKEINERGNKEKRTEEREKEWEEERHYCNFLFTKSATQETLKSMISMRLFTTVIANPS